MPTDFISPSHRFLWLPSLLVYVDLWQPLHVPIKEVRIWTKTRLFKRDVKTRNYTNICMATMRQHSTRKFRHLQKERYTSSLVHSLSSFYLHSSNTCYRNIAQ